MAKTFNDNDVERFNNYEFITPPVMVDDDLELKLTQTFPYDPDRGWVPYYQFYMVHSTSGAIMGDIDLRIGLTPKLKLLGGHIGYEVNEPYRGNRYAARGCRLLLPIAGILSINPVLITCAPDNIASVITIESLDAHLIDTYKVEIEPGIIRWTNLYHVHLD